MRLESIHLYPVKAGSGIGLERSMVEASGLRHDRRWMVVDPAGRFVTRRDEPALAGLRLTDEREDWRMEFRGAAGPLLPKSPDGGTVTEVEVWGDRVSALPGPAEVTRWLSGMMERNVSLVYVADADLRPVSPEFGLPGDVVSFADGYPVLLVNEASVRAVSDVAGRALRPGRFRPNLVVSGAGEFAEDDWAGIRIGDVTFDVVKPCARCQVVDRDPDTGKRDGGVLRALGTFRRSGSSVLFGENLIPRSTGEVCVGDTLEIVRRRKKGSVIMEP